MLASRDGSWGVCSLRFAAVPTTPYCLKLAVLSTCILSLVLWVFEFGVLLYDLCRRFSEQTFPDTVDSSFASPLLGRWPRLIWFCFISALPNFRWPLLHSWGVGEVHILILGIPPSFLPRGPGEVGRQDEVGFRGTVPTDWLSGCPFLCLLLWLSLPVPTWPNRNLLVHVGQ